MGGADDRMIPKNSKKIQDRWPEGGRISNLGGGVPPPWHLPYEINTYEMDWSKLKVNSSDKLRRARKIEEFDGSKYCVFLERSSKLVKTTGVWCVAFELNVIPIPEKRQFEKNSLPLELLQFLVTYPVLLFCRPMIVSGSKSQHE